MNWTETSRRGNGDSLFLLQRITFNPSSVLGGTKACSGHKRLLVLGDPSGWMVSDLEPGQSVT